MADGADVEVTEAQPEDDVVREAGEKTESGVPVYQTDMGREVLGGGGITPDLVVRDTLTAEEQTLYRAIQDDVALFSNVRYEFGVEYSHDHPELAPGFTVTDGMLEEFRARLAAEGLEIDPAVFSAASALLKRQLANEISVAAFSREEGLKRLLQEDPQVLTALELLNTATSKDELFALLPGYASSHDLVLGADYQLHPGEDGAGHPY